jgi:hypothetical protein
LGPSPWHASSVNLVLKLDTGLVSPQFHVQYDDFFETVRPLAGNPPTFSQWQYISGLKSWQDKEKLPPSEGATPSLEPEQTILQSESQPNELIVNLQDKSQPDELDSGDDTANATIPMTYLIIPMINNGTTLVQVQCQISVAMAASASLHDECKRA